MQMGPDCDHVMNILLRQGCSLKWTKTLYPSKNRPNIQSDNSSRSCVCLTFKRSQPHPYVSSRHSCMICPISLEIKSRKHPAACSPASGDSLCTEGPRTEHTVRGTIPWRVPRPASHYHHFNKSAQARP